MLLTGLLRSLSGLRKNDSEGGALQVHGVHGPKYLASLYQISPQGDLCQMAPIDRVELILRNLLKPHPLEKS